MLRDVRLAVIAGRAPFGVLDDGGGGESCEAEGADDPVEVMLCLVGG
jgi:hypothetical protein